MVDILYRHFQCDNFGPHLTGIVPPSHALSISIEICRVFRQMRLCICHHIEEHAFWYQTVSKRIDLCHHRSDRSGLLMFIDRTAVF